MLCDRCKDLKLVLADVYLGGTSRIHHCSYADLLAAVEDGCELCQKIHCSMPPTFIGHDDYSDKNIYWELFPKRKYGDHKANHLVARVLQRHPNGFYAAFEVFVDEDAAAAKYIFGRPITQETYSDVCFDRARKWISECNEKHSETCPQFPHSLLPTRLVDVGNFDEPCQPRLYISGKSETGSWVALSHCWGKQSNLVTLESNIDEHVISLPMHAMPATFRHAILATRRLGYCMLWIDSLCIIQRSREDWVLESCRMQHYYKHAVLTLAADRAKGDEDGFLGPHSNSSDKIIAVRFQMPTAEANVYLRDEIELEKTPSPVPGTLGSRAWALQEDLLSPRTLHFTEEQLIWECQFHKLHESVASSGSEDLLLQTSRVDNITKRFFLKPHSRHLHPVWSKSELDWSKRWYNIVDNFTRRDITYQSNIGCRVTRAGC